LNKVDAEKQSERSQLQNRREAQKHAPRQQQRRETLDGEHGTVEKHAGGNRGEPPGWKRLKESQRRTGLSPHDQRQYHA
jgi:hypothetical protein